MADAHKQLNTTTEGGEAAAVQEQGHVPGTFPHPPQGHGPGPPESVPSEPNQCKQVPPAAEGTNINNLFAIAKVSGIYSPGLLIQELNNVCMAFRPCKSN